MRRRRHTRSQASEPGADEEDAVKYGAYILPIDWIIGGLLFEFRSSAEEGCNVL